MLSHNFVINILYCVWVVNTCFARASLLIVIRCLQNMLCCAACTSFHPAKGKSSSLKNPEFRLTARAASGMTDISYAMDLRSSH